MTKEAAQSLGDPVLGYALVTLGGHGERQEPIVEANPRTLTLFVRVMAKEKAGDTVARLRLFTAGACCFDGPALVRARSHVTHSAFGEGVALLLELPPPPPPSWQQTAMDTYRDLEVITDTVDNLVGTGAQVALARADNTEQRSARTARVLDRSSATRGLVLELREGKSVSARKGQRLAVHVDLYGTHIALVSTYRSRRGERVMLDWPDEVRVWWRRNSDRLVLADKTVEVELRLPITGELSVRPAYNLSAAGVALQLSPTDTVLVGTSLTGIELLLSGRAVLADAVVRNVRAAPDGGFLAGLSLTPVDQENRDALRAFIERHVRCHLRQAGASDLDALWPLWDTLGLFSRRHVALTKGVAALEMGRKILLARGHDLLIAMVGTAESALQGSAELLRTYKNTWTLQHLGTTGTYLVREQLLAAVLEEGLRRESFGWLHALCDPDAADPLLSAVARLGLDAGEVSERRWTLLVPPPRMSLIGEDAVELQPPDEHTRAWLLARLAAAHSSLALLALDLGDDELDLPAIGAAYARLGLVRERRHHIAVGISGPLGFAVIESASRGTSLAGLSDLARLYTVAGDDDRTRGPTLLALAALATRLGQTRGAVPLLLVEPTAKAPLVAAGYHALGSRVELVCSRAAVARLAGYLRTQGAP